MACCIFAAMLITNFLVFYRKLKSLLGFNVEDDDLWQPKPTVSPWKRHLKMALPMVLLSSTAVYGTLHWHHITAWMNPDNCQNTLQEEHCGMHH